MNMSSLDSELKEIELDQFGLNRLLLNLILQIFIKNNIDDPNDIMNSISEYLDLPTDCSAINSIANQLNIMKAENSWIWIIS